MLQDYYWINCSLYKKKRTTPNVLRMPTIDNRNEGSSDCLPPDGTLYKNSSNDSSSLGCPWVFAQSVK